MKFLLFHTLWDRKSEQPPGAIEGGSIKEKLEIFIVMCCQLLDSYWGVLANWASGVSQGLSSFSLTMALRLLFWLWTSTGFIMVDHRMTSMQASQPLLLQFLFFSSFFLSFLFCQKLLLSIGFPDGSEVKNLPIRLEPQECGFNPWLGKIPWRRAWQPTPVFLPGESHGQRGDWWVIVHKVTKSWTPLKQLSMYTLYYLLEKEMATHSSILPYRIPWTKEPGRLESMESQRLRHDWVTEHVHYYALLFFRILYSYCVFPAFLCFINMKSKIDFM